MIISNFCPHSFPLHLTASLPRVLLHLLVPGGGDLGTPRFPRPGVRHTDQLAGTVILHLCSSSSSFTPSGENALNFFYSHISSWSLSSTVILHLCHFHPSSSSSSFTPSGKNTGIHIFLLISLFSHFFLIFVLFFFFVQGLLEIFQSLSPLLVCEYPIWYQTLPLNSKWKNSKS